MPEAVKTDWVRLSVGLISLLVVLILFLMPTIKEKLKTRQVLYCSFENNITDSTLLRNECTTMKITSKDMDKAGIDRFGSMGNKFYGCTPDINKARNCKGENLYFSYYPLVLFCEDCEIDGFMCIKYYIDYYSDDTELISLYENKFLQEKLNSSIGLDDMFDKCGER